MNNYAYSFLAIGCLTILVEALVLAGVAWAILNYMVLPFFGLPALSFVPVLGVSILLRLVLTLTTE